MTKFAVLGGSGYLGGYLCEFLAAHGHEAVAVSRGPSATTDSIAISGLDEIAPAIRNLSGRIDVVINSIAVASHEKCIANPQLARLTNAAMPGLWAKTSKESGVGFIQVSTDAVFDGEQDNPYTENDAANPQTIYGVTKHDGELAVAENNPDALVIRTNFFGWSPTRGSGVLEFFYRNLTAQNEITGFGDYFVSSTYMGFLAQAMIALQERNLSGTYHVCARDSVSKYDFGLLVAECFGLPAASLKRGSVQDAPALAPRGRNLSLSPRKFEQAVEQLSPTVHEALWMAKDELHLYGNRREYSGGREETK